MAFLASPVHVIRAEGVALRGTALGRCGQQLCREPSGAGGVGGEEVMLLGAAKEEVLVWAREQAAGKGAAPRGGVWGEPRAACCLCGPAQGSPVPRS